MAVSKVISYLGTHCKFTNLPTYYELRDGLEVEVDSGGPSGISPVEIPHSMVQDKTSMVRRIVSHLWGGNDSVERVFSGVEIESMDEMYGETKPLRVKVSFPEGGKGTFYVKPFEEKRMFGLELENILSPHSYDYSIGGGAIIEDEIHGMEDDVLGRKTLEDKGYLEELVRFNYKTFLTLLGDMHRQNFLVSRSDSGESKVYNIRPIDFDKQFYFDESVVRTGFVIPKDEDAIKGKMGERRYDEIVAIEKEKIRRKYLSNSERVSDLLDLIGESRPCNEHLTGLSQELAIYYGGNEEKFYSADNMGDLLKMHFVEQLNI